VLCDDLDGWGEREAQEGGGLTESDTTEVTAAVTG